MKSSYTIELARRKYERTSVPHRSMCVSYKVHLIAAVLLMMQLVTRVLAIYDLRHHLSRDITRRHARLHRHQADPHGRVTGPLAALSQEVVPRATER